MSRLIRLAVIVISCATVLEHAAHANRNFVPDWTFTGSSLADAEQLGDAKWTAQNGELTGTPSSPGGGWLLFKNPVQDVQMATSFRCAEGCQAGLLLRLEKTADGFKGVFVSISDMPGAFAVTLDRQGRLVTKEPLERGGGTVRSLAAAAAAGTTRRRGEGGWAWSPAAVVVPVAALACQRARLTRGLTTFFGQATGTPSSRFSTQTSFARG